VVGKRRSGEDFAMKGICRSLFGARAQVAAGVVFVVATLLQAWWWGIRGGPPGAVAIFWLSIEALLFAAYGVVASGLGYRATERVESVIVEEADTVEIDVDRYPRIGGSCGTRPAPEAVGRRAGA
jgi:hypothetical protein